MTLLEFIRHLLELLATRLYFTDGNSGPYFAVVISSLFIMRFIFKRNILLKLKLRHILKRGLQHGSSYIRKEKSKPDFNILKSVSMDGMSYRYREWTNPLAYFCTDTSRSDGKAVSESESNSDEGSSHGENEDSVEKGSKMGEIGSDDSKTCISSTKAVFERLPASQSTHKRKAKSDKSESSKRSKSTNSVKVGEASNPTQEITDVNIKISSKMSSNYRNQKTTIQLSDRQLTHVHDAFPKSDRTDVQFPKIPKEILSIEKSKTSRFASQVPSPLKDKKPDFKDFSCSNSEDKSMQSSVREKSHDFGGALKNTFSFSPAKSTATKSTQTETTEKSYPVPKKIWKNLVQDKQCNTPSDPRIRYKNTSASESRLGPSRNLQENQSFGITQNNAPTRQNIRSISNSGTTSAENYSKSATGSSQNVLECPPIFPEINFSTLLIEQSEQLKSSESLSFDPSERVPEVVRQFFKNIENASKKALKTSNENFSSLEGSVFSSELEKKFESENPLVLNPLRVLTPLSDVEGPVVASDILPCSSTSESHASVANDKDERSKDISKIKTYPGLSLQPLKVKKDARYQKKFYKEKKEITLPKKLGEVIQWAAKKPRDEVTVLASDTLPLDEVNLPIDEYHERAQVLTQSFMDMFDSAREQKAKKKLDKKNRIEQRERMKRENTGYIESSFKEESPSSESSSDSLPTSGDSPVKARTPPVSRSKIPPDYDLSMVEVSPLKPVVKVSPRFSSQSDSLCQAPPGIPNIRHLSDDENVRTESSDFSISHEFSSLSVLIHFIDRNKEVVNPKNALFCRDMLWSPDASHANQRLEPFYRIESVAPVSCSPISVEEFLDEMLKAQQTYYQLRFNEDRRVFKVFSNAMTICVIPLRRPQSPDGDYELDGDILVKRERRTELEQNFAPITPDFDYILDINMCESENFGMVPLTPNKVKRDQNLREQVSSQASKQMHKVHASDLPASTIRDDWTLWEIELGENKVPRKRSGKHFSQYIPTQGSEVRIESKMEEWPADVYQSDATSAAKNIKHLGPKSAGSSRDTLPVLFGYPSPELLSRIMANDPKSQCTAASPIRRKTKSESAKYSGSNVITVKGVEPPKAQTSQGVSNKCREKSVGKCYETTNPTRTEIELHEYAFIRQDLEPFESNPIIVASGRQESPGGYRVTAEETVNMESNQTSSAVEQNNESIQQTCDFANKSRSTPEKDVLTATDVLESSSDPENEDSDATGKERSKK